MPDDAPIQRPPLVPFRALQREDGQNGKVKVDIINARHWCDTVQFAENNNLAGGLAVAWLRLLGLANSYASAKPPYLHDGTTQPGTPGRGFVLEVHPEAFTHQSTPSFEWLLTRDGQRVMNGGLVFHESDRTWSLHS